MALAIVLTAKNVTAEENMVLRGVYGGYSAAVVAKDVLAREMYKPRTAEILADYDTAETLFNGVNMQGDSCVAVGDMILWVETGKRELCLLTGWQII